MRVATWLLVLLWAVDPGWSQSPRQQAGRDPEERSENLSVGPGDLLVIEVLGLEEFNRKVRILGDGTIKLPLVGYLSVEGLTPNQVESLVGTTLEERSLVNDPLVSVFVEEYVSQGVVVMGSVSNPGTYQVVGGKTLFDVLFEAGGISSSAREVVVLRELAEGQMQRITVDATRLVGEGDLSADMPLVAGDIVMVPDPVQFTIYVSGAVSRQGPIRYEAGQPMTVLQAIAAAGGASERAKLKSVMILRNLEGGVPETIVLNMKKIRKGQAPDVVLEPNDTVVVGERFF
ncbi:MAG: polysaccharide biosynthesis/export family protein [Thermoanaerobaculia bacterium]|nr:polysaccharide biosynthesis/export family protein [Thermoanaerobaculia bacterium]